MPASAQCPPPVGQCRKDLVDDANVRLWISSGSCELRNVRLDGGQMLDAGGEG